MNIQALVKKTLGDNLSTLGAESITINGQSVDAVLSEVDQETSLIGGRRVERTLTGQFPTNRDMSLRTGMSVYVDKKKWKIERFQRGQAMTTITLIEPNRITD